MEPASILRRETCIKNLAPFFKGLPIRNIKPSHCDVWLQRRGQDIAPSTFAHELGTMRLLFEFAVARGLLLGTQPATSSARSSRESKSRCPPANNSVSSSRPCATKAGPWAHRGKVNRRPIRSDSWPIQVAVSRKPHREAQEVAPRPVWSGAADVSTVSSGPDAFRATLAIRPTRLSGSGLRRGLRCGRRASQEAWTDSADPHGRSPACRHDGIRFRPLRHRRPPAAGVRVGSGLLGGLLAAVIHLCACGCNASTTAV